MYTDYEIRLHRLNGNLSIVMLVTALSASEARRQAEEMLQSPLANAHILHDGHVIDSIYTWH